MTGRKGLVLTGVVLRKELKDALRDRRSILTLIFSAVFGPVLVAFMLNTVASRQREIDEVRIPVAGTAHAPALIEWLRQQAGVEVVEFPPPADEALSRAGTDDDGDHAPGVLERAERAVRDRREDVVLVIPDDFAERFLRSAQAPVRIVSDTSRTTTRPKVQRVRSLLQRYSTEIGSLRLIARGVSPAIAAPLRLEDVEVSSAQQRAATILNFIPLFIVLAAFTGGMQIATDSTAGERERGSLEPLLVNPAPRSAIVGGKWLAATVFSTVSVVTTVLLVLVLLRTIPLQDLGIRFRLGPQDVVGLLAAAAPMCLLSTGIQVYLATFAKSFKEAQSYMGFLIMVPMLPGLVAAVYPLGNELWMYPIPILGQHVLLSDVLGGRTSGPLMFVLAAGSALVVALGLVRLATQLFHRERIIFGR